MPHRQIKSEINEYARKMRSEPTEAEFVLWTKVLRKRQFEYEFRRQFVIDNKYIADFICLRKKLIIEIDGGQHLNNKNDKIRDNYLKEQKFRVLRIWNNEILNNLEGVYQKIKQAIEAPSPEIKDFDPSARVG